MSVQSIRRQDSQIPDQEDSGANRRGTGRGVLNRFNSGVALLVSLIVHLTVFVILAQVILPILRQGTKIDTVVDIKSQFNHAVATEVSLPQSSSVSGSVAASSPSFSRSLSSTQVARSSESPSREPKLFGDTGQTLRTDPSDLRISHQELLTKIHVPMRYMPMHQHRGEARISKVDGTSAMNNEISGELEQIAHDGDAIVVWLFDQSLSMQQDMDALAEQLVTTLEEIEDDQRTKMMHYVVAFGSDVRLLQNSTIKGFATANAIYKLPADPSGIENTFGAVEWCVDQLFNDRKWRKFRERQKLLVVWTDESGDDSLRLENTIQKCLAANVRVDVIGPSAVLGAQTGYTAFRHPDDGLVYHLPVHRGPDSAFPQKLNLGYWFRGVPEGYDEAFRGPYQGTSPRWYGGSNLNSLLSGFSPYALTRLTKQTGGRYIIYDRPGDRPPFELDDIKDYAPDYRSFPEIQNEIRQRPLRQIVLAASAMTWNSKLAGRQEPLFNFNRNLGWQSSLQFQSVSLPNAVRREYTWSVKALQEVEQALALYVKAASIPNVELDPTVSQYTDVKDRRRDKTPDTQMDRAKELQNQQEELQVSLLEELYHDEPSPRWRAWCDLNFGRLLAISVRLREYLITIEPLHNPKANGLHSATNSLRLQSSSIIRGGAVSEKRLQVAEKLLRRCIENNPNTPWEVMAKRELQYPVGLDVIQAAVPPPPPVTSTTPSPPPPKRPTLPSL